MLSKIWAAKDLSKALKIEVFEVLVVSSLLYNYETWVIKTTSRNRLKDFEMACLRKTEVCQEETESETQRFKTD